MTAGALRRLGATVRALYVGHAAVLIAATLLALWLVTLVARRPGRAVAFQITASRLLLGCLRCRYTIRGKAPLGHGPLVFVAKPARRAQVP